MNIILFVHPSFSESQSMPRYANWLYEGMTKRGHTVSMWAPTPRFYNLPTSKSLRKWAGYIDQYILFPLEIRRRINETTKDTLFVYTDHALGPWVPLTKHRAHIIHCHDFLAQLSSIGLVAENPTSESGKKYQNYIKRGYSSGRNFISISRKTQSDLHNFLNFTPNLSKIVYNGLSREFSIGSKSEIRKELTRLTDIQLHDGFILHIGSNQWYKNRKGVIEIYDAWRKLSTLKIPLVMVGANPPDLLLKKKNESVFREDIHFLTGKSDDFVKLAYQGASLFLFPSLAEGFGWPIAEAMACGTPVITTNEAPMTEVAGEAAILIDRRPISDIESSEWASKSAEQVDKILHFTEEQKMAVISAGELNARRFNSDIALDSIEEIYKFVIKQYDR